MKVGIHKDFYDPNNSYIKKYEKILTFNKIDVEWLDINEEDFWSKVKELDLFMYRWRHFDNDRMLAHTILPIIEKNMGVKIFPNWNTGWHFDDKVKQYYLLTNVGFPHIKSWIFWNKESALEWVRNAEFPIIFKLKGGAGSSNVIKVDDKKLALKLINKLFGKGVISGKMPIKNSLHNNYLSYVKVRAKSYIKNILNKINNKKDDYFWQKDKNYILFQQFLPNNKFDTRITIIGNRAFGFRRMTREDDFRASGSGNIDHDMSKIDINCVKLAFEVSQKMNFQTMSYDFIYNIEGGIEICEISYTFQDRAIHNCKGYWDENLNWREGHFWPQYCQLIDLLDRADLKQPEFN